MEQKTKKIILVVVCGVCFFAAGFITSGVISKYRYTKSTNKLEQLLGDGYDKSRGLYEQLEQRLKELEVFRGQVTELESTIGQCRGIVEQSESTFGRLGKTMDELRTATSTSELTSKNIGITIGKLKTGQSRIEALINELERNNKELKGKFRELQDRASIEQK